MNVTIDSEEVRRTFLKLPIASVDKLNQLIQGAAIDTQREMRKEVNVGATGDLRRDIKYKMTGRLSAVVGSQLARAEWLEEGAGPRWVSVKEGSPLRRWADMKGINPWAVQKSIAKKGTKAHPFVKPTFQVMRPRVERDVVGGFSAFVRSVDNAGL